MVEGGDKKVVIFPKDISLKAKAIVRLKFKLAYFKATVQYVSHRATGTTL